MPIRLDAIARFFRMDDEAWRRHANPWSVYTRLASLPLLIVAVWSREWLGWWSLLPILLVVVWLFLNPHVFPPVDEPKSWAAKGILGERFWLQGRGKDLPRDYAAVLSWLIVPGVTGLLLMVWGLIWLSIWPTLFGATLVVLAQLWRIDRFGLLHDELLGLDDRKPPG